MQVVVPITGPEARFLSEAAIRKGMDLPNFLYWAAVTYANQENRRTTVGNQSVPALLFRRR